MIEDFKIDDVESIVSDFIESDDYRKIKSHQEPKSYILGGQAGAGKSNLTIKIKASLNNDVLEINGDDVGDIPSIKLIDGEYWGEEHDGTRILLINKQGEKVGTL